MLCVLIHFANCGAFLFTEQHFYFININPACLINSTHSDFSPFVHWHTEKSVSQLISIIGIDQAQLVSFSSSSFYLLLLHLLLYSSAFPSTSALSSVLSCDNLKQDDFRGAECRANPLPSLVFSLFLFFFYSRMSARQTVHNLVVNSVRQCVARVSTASKAVTHQIHTQTHLPNWIISPWQYIH